MNELAERHCVPCKGRVPPLSGEPPARLMRILAGDWRLIGEHHLEKEYRFPDFRAALSFTNRIGDLTEQQGHHPDIHLAWGKVGVTIWTHTTDGLQIPAPVGAGI
jgi:4a-hydroxytetrahydrobiopterin dehydratase